MLQPLEKNSQFTIPPPAWLPAPLRERLHELGRLEYTTAFSRADKKILRKRKKIRPSKWVERHRVLTMSSLPGPWRNRITPYLTDIMDASFFTSVRTVIMCKAPQTGGSEAIHNCIGYAMDRDPGPVLYVYPDIQTARDNSNDRIQPMIESSPRLRGYKSSLFEDFAAMRINLQHMPIYLGWATSPARLANKPIKHLVFDETDKYPDTAGKREADPISLGEKRNTTYKWTYKRWKISTPTIETGPIWQALTKEAQALFDYWVRCPYCEKTLLMAFEQIKFPKDARDPEKVETENLATYECQHCKSHWSDEDRNKAVRRGHWQERESGLELFEHLAARRPAKIGFHIPSWLSVFVGLSEVAAAFLRGLKDKEKLKDFLNAHKAEPWKIYTAEREEDVILQLRDDRPRGRVPAGGIVAGLTAGVDTQADGFYYEIGAWGWGEEQESWQIREGYVTSFKALEQVLWEDVYQDAAGIDYVVQMVVQDAMGGTQRKSAGVGTRTSEVYDFCRKHRGRIVPFKGEQRMNQRFAYTKLDYYPGTNIAIPGGIQLLRANVTYYKNKLANKLEVAGADPGAWHLHSETEREWARQMCAEYVDENGLWQQIGSRENHAWDVSVYRLVAAAIIGMKFWAEKKQPQAAPAASAKPQGAGAGNWLPKKKGWLNR